MLNATAHLHDHGTNTLTPVEVNVEKSPETGEVRLSWDHPEFDVEVSLVLSPHYARIVAALLRDASEDHDDPLVTLVELQARIESLAADYPEESVTRSELLGLLEPAPEPERVALRPTPVLDINAPDPEAEALRYARAVEAWHGNA
jgi:hypothetical protein